VSVHFVTGRPGNGKGLVSVQVVVDELVQGERPVITNLPVRIGPWVRRWRSGGKWRCQAEMGLQAYLLREYGKDFDVLKRVHVLQEDEVGEFYLRRVVDGKLVVLSCERDSQGRVVSFDTSAALASGGHVYVVDEAWRNFGAREWQQTGKGVLFYGAQHRHLGDDWYIVTQHTKQVDTAFRMIAQDYWVCTNHSKRRLGVFRQPDVFSVAVYGVPPESRSEPPMHRRVFRLDKAGLGSCYDTTAGHGIAGAGGADIQERRRGLHIGWAIVLVVVIGGLVLLGSWGAGRFVERKLSGEPKGVPQRVGVPQSGSGPVPAVWGGGVVSLHGPARASSLSASSAAPSAVSVKVESAEPVYWTGSAVLPGGVCVVCLSDGRVLSSARGEILRAGDGWVETRQGVVYRARAR